VEFVLDILGLMDALKIERAILSAMVGRVLMRGFATLCDIPRGRYASL